MSEEIKEYSKTITFTKLAKYVLSTFCFPKIMRDSEKPDPLKVNIDKLKKRTDEERNERLKAYRIWERNKTDKNANEVLEEIADEINFLLFQAGVIADFKSMTRE